jgi:hypothetical protein
MDCQNEILNGVYFGCTYLILKFSLLNNIFMSNLVRSVLKNCISKASEKRILVLKTLFESFGFFSNQPPTPPHSILFSFLLDSKIPYSFFREQK